MNTEEANKLYTEGGIQYEEVTTPDGKQLKVRYDDSSKRLEEDEETFQEYKFRQKALKRFKKSRNKGFLHWHREWGPMTEAKKNKVRQYMGADDETKEKILAQAENMSKEAVIAKQIMKNNEQIG